MHELTDEQHSARKKLNVALADFEQDRDERVNPYWNDRRRVPEIEDAARAFIATLNPKPTPHGLADEQVERLRVIANDLPSLVADMLNAWYAPSNPLIATVGDYRGLKHAPHGERDFDGMVAILAAALGG